MGENIILNQLEKHKGQKVILHRTHRVESGILTKNEFGLFCVGESLFLLQNISNAVILSGKLNIIVTY